MYLVFLLNIKRSRIKWFDLLFDSKTTVTRIFYPIFKKSRLFILLFKYF
jgi:hypothetical protein